ncbi:helix-turn-helix transcriptional regulator [Archangium violaceum]|nr:helix-turn-helix transcriptional regulator [Archangium violaceum]
MKRKLGAALLAARERSGLTQADVSSMVGLVPAVYGRIERGQMLPSVPTLYKLCLSLHISADVLLGFGAEQLLVESPSSASVSPPELLRLTKLLRELPPDSLRTLGALASAIAQRG